MSISDASARMLISLLGPGAVQRLDLTTGHAARRILRREAVGYDLHADETGEVHQWSNRAVTS